MEEKRKMSDEEVLEWIRKEEEKRQERFASYNGFKADMSTVYYADIFARVKRNEKFNGIKYPDSYIKFINTYNCAKPITCEFMCDGRWEFVARFLGFVPNFEDAGDIGWCDIGVVSTQLFERLIDEDHYNDDEDGTPLIPIADMGFGDYVCLDFRKDKSNPSVCVWWHELSEPISPVTSKVADTFSEFIAMLR